MSWKCWRANPALRAIEWAARPAGSVAASLEAIAHADMIVRKPLHSLLPNLLVPELVEALPATDGSTSATDDPAKGETEPLM